ncbi:LamG domain-containing protein [Candidatus Parcubacteria bacterium]|nr:LamG domain-containing protein [Candidatus Parcubacteria bacterium]
MVIVSYVTSKEIVTKAPPAQGLVGWWPFDSAFVTDKIYDRAGRGNHGYFVGGATSTAKVTGKLGKALSFDGVNDYVNIPTISVPSSITVSAWVFSTNFDQSGMIVMKKPVNVQWALFLETNDAVSQGIKWRGNNAVGDEACATASFPSNNQWHHIVATQTGTTCNIYLDGALVKTATVSAIANGTTPGTNDILISTYDGSSYPFNGKIDDVRIYNRALTYAEVLQLYNSR